MISLSVFMAWERAIQERTASSRKEDEIERYARLDGCYVLSVPAPKSRGRPPSEAGSLAEIWHGLAGITLAKLKANGEILFKLSTIIPYTTRESSWPYATCPASRSS